MSDHSTDDRPAALAEAPLTSLSEGVLTLPISLETAGNSLDAGALTQAAHALAALADGRIDAGAVLLVGLGRNFCAGGNVSHFAAADDRPAMVAGLADDLHRLVRELDALDVPIVAAVIAPKVAKVRTHYAGMLAR